MTTTPTSYRELSNLPKRVFVVGDIHGCPDESTVLLEFLKDAQGLSADDVVIFVGDYVDRGSGSRQVLDYLVEFKKQFPDTIFLRGNHEEMMLAYLGFEGELGEVYIKNGGNTTIQSYGLNLKSSPEDLLAALPKAHLEFLQSLDRYVVGERFIVAHAGLNPLRDIASQLNEDLYWIRDEFISNIHYFDRTIIFGHTPYQDVLFHLPYKIGIDTGLVYGNTLSCIELTGSAVFQVGRGEKNVKVASFVSKGGEGLNLASSPQSL